MLTYIEDHPWNLHDVYAHHKISESSGKVASNRIFSDCKRESCSENERGYAGVILPLGGADGHTDGGS